MANVFGKIRKRLRRRVARRPETRVEARPDEESNISLRRRLNERLNMYIREADVIRENYDLNPNEADRILEQYDNAIDILNICNRENELGIVSAFPVNDNDINVITYNYLSSNGVDPNAMQFYRAEEWYSPDTMARMRNTNPPLNPQQERARQSAIYSNMPLPRTPEEFAQQRARQLNPDNQRNSNVRYRHNPVARGNMNSRFYQNLEAYGQQQRQEQGGIAQPDAGRARNSQRRLNERPEERLEERSERGATGISSNNQEAIVNDILSAYGAGQNESIRQDFTPRGDSLNNNGAESGRPEQRISTVEPNVMDNNANTDIYDSTQNYYRSGVINRFENAELPPTPHASESNSAAQEEADVNELVSLYEDREEADVNESVSSNEDREEADVNELVSSYENREEVDVNELVSSYEDREEADVNDLVSSYQEQENVRDVTSENYSDRRVSSSFDSSIVSYDASNSLDISTTSYDTRSSLGTSTTSYDTRSSLGTSTTSYDTSSSLDSSYISYDRSSSLDSSYFSSDRSHNPESNTNTYNQISSDSSSDRRNSSQLVRNDSYQQTNNPNNQRRNNQSFRY